MDKMYIYKEHCDENAYGEEIVELYVNRDDAVRRLKERVSRAYDMPFEDIPEAIDLNEDDTFKEDYVSIDNGDGAVSFWIVEERTPIGTANAQKGAWSNLIRKDVLPSQANPEGKKNVRLNWNNTLKRTRFCFGLSRDIGFWFTTQDLVVLACLHEAGLHRTKIEELLEECGFCQIKEIMQEGRYDELRKMLICPDGCEENTALHQGSPASGTPENGKRHGKIACDIQWDTDGDEEVLKTLPKEIFIPDDIDQDPADYISDLTGFCHFGFKLRAV